MDDAGEENSGQAVDVFELAMEQARERIRKMPRQLPPPPRENPPALLPAGLPLDELRRLDDLTEKQVAAWTSSGDLFKTACLKLSHRIHTEAAIVTRVRMREEYGDESAWLVSDVTAAKCLPRVAVEFRLVHNDLRDYLQKSDLPALLRYLDETRTEALSLIEKGWFQGRVANCINAIVECARQLRSEVRTRWAEAEESEKKRWRVDPDEIAEKVAEKLLQSTPASALSAEIQGPPKVPTLNDRERKALLALREMDSEEPGQVWSWQEIQFRAQKVQRKGGKGISREMGTLKLRRLIEVIPRKCGQKGGSRISPSGKALLGAVTSR